ncbi:hypothetical protein [Ferrimonas pelagia]|uniref:Uncharacterized protein n=1 Tax=Ferrimonas pelagia TaxID=1177826 RepID=A0ABP9ESY1_9GAMM
MTLRELKLAGIGYGLYMMAFFIAFAPYAFVSDAAEAGQMMSGLGGWAFILASLLIPIGWGFNVWGGLRALKTLIAGPNGQAFAALLLNLLPALLLPALLWANRAIIF